MQFSYILIDGSTFLDATLELIKAHDAFLCVAVCRSMNEGINKILELKPDIVFMNISEANPKTEELITFSLLSELHEFLDVFQLQL